MRIDLAGWSSLGLRTPDIDINLLDAEGNPAKVALIQMPNGTGIPTLCTQFVGFTINTERPGFVLPLEKAAGSVKFLTMFRKTDGTARLLPGLPKDGVVQTDSAVLVEDRDYFMNFGLKDEQEA